MRCRAGLVKGVKGFVIALALVLVPALCGLLTWATRQERPRQH